MAFFYLLVNPAFATLFSSICEYHRAFQQMFKARFDEINEQTKLKRFSSVKLSLIKSISFHLSVKHLFYQTAKVYSTFILIQLIGSMVFMAISIFQIDLMIHDFNISILIMIFGVLISASNLFLYCFYGKHTTDSYIAFADCLFESNWLNLPNDLQKYFVPMIAHAQKPLFYHGYIVDLNLKTLSKVRIIFESIDFIV